MAGSAGHFDYHRTVVGYHGTRRATAQALADGAPFDPSTNDDDWLGHGVYFWEYAPRQAWRWALNRHGPDAAVVAAMIRLGRCLDLLDPASSDVVVQMDQQFTRDAEARGKAVPRNFRSRKLRDCAVFNHLHGVFLATGLPFTSTRAVFVPMGKGGFERLWPHSGVFSGGHIQLCVRDTTTILAVWPIRRDGHYGKEQEQA